MNKKAKKWITPVLIAVFFLIGGMWYLMQTQETPEKYGESLRLTGIFDAAQEKQLTATPQPEVKLPEEGMEPKEELVVYVCGAVNEPGIYTLPEDSRLYEVIALAGGFSAKADPAYHNLAREISDGERIYILSYEETDALTTAELVGGELGAGIPQEQSFLINLNTATAEQLTSLPGIGDAKAVNILEYRKQVGQFKDIEEIMNVSGIGEAMFEKIKDKITVK